MGYRSGREALRPDARLIAASQAARLPEGFDKEKPRNRVTSNSAERWLRGGATRAECRDIVGVREETEGKVSLRTTVASTEQRGTNATL